ncbi:MAG: hypothetical protein A07HB70_02521 [uncultured archaeon A07HB70]|nr:MAG: hypothetical protein A07HB70_02521 [uncultured archaeon A07HB70]
MRWTGGDGARRTATAVEWAAAACDSNTGPTSVGRKCLRTGRVEWARVPTTAFRVDGGLRTTVNCGQDARGDWPGNDAHRRLRRLRRQHDRLVGRNDRVTEAFETWMAGANLGIPERVRVDAARLVHVAKERRLPCRRLSWEALAGGAVLLAARNRLEAEGVPPRQFTPRPGVVVPLCPVARLPGSAAPVSGVPPVSHQASRSDSRPVHRQDS